MNEKYKQDFIRAGVLANQVRLFGKSLIKIGASYNDVITKINQKILSLGARPAFPPQIALNHVAAHFLPQPDEDIIFGEDVVKLDVGICYQGAIGDCAVTIDLSGKHQALVEAVEEALLFAEQAIKVGQLTSEIGQIIEERITARGFKPIKNLSGHGLGYYQIHTAPTIPNYNDRSSVRIQPGMTFAIEPFATDGKGLIYEEGDATIFAFVKERPVQSALLRSLIAKIKLFNALPFAIHDLIHKGISAFDAKQGLDQLLKAGIIVEYAPLVEEANGLVAQAENSVLIDKNGQVFITTR